MRSGLLGRKLAHSYSPAIHEKLADYSYTLFEKEPDEVEAFLKNGPWDTLNVTIPYKKNAFACCTRLSATAEKTGSVNTLLRLPDGGLYGDNTDVYGFRCLLLSLLSGEKTGAGKKALIFGNGGAAPSVREALLSLGYAPVIISRRGEDNYTNLERHRDAKLLVNTTPVGMYPENGQAVADLLSFPEAEAVLDLIYNPARTALLLQAEELGIPAANGLLMLTAQAKKSAELFLGKALPDALIPEITAALERDLGNLIMIGMPGAGKTTIGRWLAEAMGRPFLDSDEEIEKRTGRKIPEILKTEGEDFFRRLETEVLAEFGKRSGCVIAAGGGVVTRKENYPLLHQNGKLIWLKRPLELLPTEGRPLSEASSPAALYRVREPLYRAFADHAVDIDEHTVENILLWYDARGKEKT